MPDLPFLSRARSHSDHIAFRTATASHTYHDILDRSALIASTLLTEVDDLKEDRVAVLVTPGFDYTSAQWGIWRAGGIKVPICLSATESEWEYALSDSQASTVITDVANMAKIAPLCARLGLRLVNVND